mgnify:CR=1 FL=1
MQFRSGLCLALIVAALASPVAADFKRIKSEKQMRQLVAGKKVVSGNGYTVVNPDGTLTGKFGGKKFSGTWKWSGKFWCRNGTLGGKEIGSDCQVWEIDGNKLRYTRNKGKGDSVISTLQ